MHPIEGLGGEGYGVFASHYHSMVKTWDHTRQLYEDLFDWLRDRGVSEWITFAEAVAEMERNQTRTQGAPSCPDA